MELIRQSQTGDKEAFAALFHQYKNLVYRTAYLILGHTQEAEDALQEVFLKVYRALASYDPQRGAFTTWLHRITANHCLNLRRSEPLDPLPLEVAEATLSMPLDLGDGALEDALTELSVRLRAVIVLRYYADLSYAEISDTLGLPLGTVKSRINLALATLRQHIRQKSGISADARQREVTQR